MRNPWIPVLFLLGVVAGCDTTVDERAYRDLADLERAMKERGFVRLGTFGDAWPATIVEETPGRDEIKFKLAKGPRHTYTGYTGYALLVVRLKGKNSEEVVTVWRARDRG